MAKLPRCAFVGLICFLAGLLAAHPLKAQEAAGKTKFSQAFTDLRKDCRGALKKVGEGQDMPLKCKGYGQYYVYIYYSALASHISINTVKGDDRIYLTEEKIEYSDSKDGKIEWRLANGKPFAVILKVARYNKEVQERGENPYQDKFKIGESFLVKGLKGYEYINFEVNARTTPDALNKARGMADAAYLKNRP